MYNDMQRKKKYYLSERYFDATMLNADFFNSASHDCKISLKLLVNERTKRINHLF